MPNVNDKNSVRQVSAEEKRSIALELRKSGANFKQIAQKLNCSNRMASNYVNKAIEEVSKLNQNTAQEIIDLEVHRLDAMLLAIAPSVNNGNLSAVDRAIKIMERRAKLLGLDKPVKIAPTTPDGELAYTPDNVRERVLQLINRDNE